MIRNFSPKKKAPKDSLSFIKGRSSGFALMVALGIMSFVLIVILGLSTLVQVNSKITSSEKNLATAKQNALFALNLAIGDLQNEMGPDQRISATASILDEFPETEVIDGVNNPYWTGAWNSNDSLEGNLVNQVVSNNRSFSDGKPSHFRRWLISTPINGQSMSPKESIFFAKNFNKNAKNAVLMVGAGTVGGESTEENSVYVPRQIINKQQENENGYAYWVGDEGVKTRIAGSPPEKIKTDLEQILNVNNAGSPRLNAIDGFANAEDISEQSDKILTLGTAQFALNQALGGNTDTFKNKFHSLSAFSRGLMVDVKNGGVRKDLSLLFASGSLPLEYNEQPMFVYDSAIGPLWNYALRYHNMYKRIRNDGGRNYINTSDFWEDAETAIPENQVKYTDIPLPVLARMQVIFSLHKQRNTFNGKYNSQLPDAQEDEDEEDEEEEPAESLINLLVPGDWEAVGNAAVEENAFLAAFGYIATDLTIFDDNPGTYFTTSDQEDYPITFKEGGSVYLDRFNPVGPVVTGYIKFTASESGEEFTEPFTLPPVGATTITIPKGAEFFDRYGISTNTRFDHFSLHFNSEAIDHPITLINFIIASDEKAGPAKFQHNEEDILHVMMTPIMYLWNP